MESSTDRRRRKQIRLAHETYRQGHVFSLTVSTRERYKWFELYRELATQVEELLLQTARERGTELFAWCLMPEHLHLLACDEDVVRFVRLVKGRSVPVARQFEPSRRLWQRSFFDHALRRAESVERVARYILANPVRASLVEHATDYRWSGSLVWPQWRDHDWLTSSGVV